jgi:hypothetical protein
MKRFHLARNRHIAISFGTLAIVAIVGFVIFTNGRNRTDAAPSPTLKVGAAVPSEFKFTGATNWWQGATNKTSMALFHTLQDGCFVSAQRKTGTIATYQTNFQKTEDQLTSTGHTITPVGTQTMTIRTSSGSRQYQLQQSSVTSPAGTRQVLGGQEFGYLQLSSGYLYIEGYCNTSGELATTIPALQAVTLNSTE